MIAQGVHEAKPRTFLSIEDEAIELTISSAYSLITDFVPARM